MMWKPKEKELTQEEAIALAKKELSPFWHGIPPQIAGIKTPTGSIVIPLDPEFKSKSWVLLFIDPTEYGGEAGIVAAKEWFSRYRNYDLGFLLFLIPPYPFIQESKFTEEFLSLLPFGFSVAVDVGGVVSDAFGAHQPPKMLLLEKGKRYFDSEGLNWLDGAELAIQKFLRTLDPGLPLLPIFVPEKEFLYDFKKIELGKEPRRGKPFELGTEALAFSGKWKQEGDQMITADSSATLGFSCSARALAIVAHSFSKTVDDSIIIVEIDGRPAYDIIAGKDLILEEDGLSVLKIRRPHVYHIFNNLPTKKVHEVLLRFPNADSCSVGLFGIRFGTPAAKGT